MVFNPAFNPLNAELNTICHLLALLGAHHILHISGIRVKGLILIPLEIQFSFVFLVSYGVRYFKYGVFVLNRVSKWMLCIPYLIMS